MRAFVATSLRNKEEALRIIEILKVKNIQVQCCLTEEGHFTGKELFEHNCKGISESDLFLAVLKDLGRDVSSEIGMAYGLGKKRIGVLYNTTPEDLMPYFSAGEIIREENLSSLIERMSTKEVRPLRFSVPSSTEYNPFIAQDINQILETKMLTEGDNVRKLERLLSERYNRGVVAVSSGTSGIIATLDALLTDKKEVILPSLSFSATPQAIIHAGGLPVFCDVLSDTWNIDPSEIVRRITKSTAAIMPVNLFGVPCDIKSIEKIGSAYGIPIVYDSCQAFGARTPQGEIGKFGMAEVFSLDATKVFNGGLGGFVTVGNEELERKIRYAKEFGNNAFKETEQRGINGRMSEFNAVLAIHNFEKIESNLELIRSNATSYRGALKDIPDIKLQNVGESNPSPQFFSVFLDKQDPEIAFKIRDKLEGISISRLCPD